MSWTPRGTCRALAAVAAVGLAACGGADKPGTTPSGGTRGGAITMSLTGFPDYMDPAMSSYAEAWGSLWTVYTPLITYRHAAGSAGAELIPGLAEALPAVSNDGKTYKLKLRSGLEYFDGKPVKASDFEHTVKRVLNLESAGSSFFQKIAGAEKYLKDGKASADIAGIETDDATGAITITLDDADGSFPFILATDFAGIVPGDTPFRNMTKDPPPGVGPFKLEHMRVNRGYDLVKNANLPAIPGIEPARVDRISVSIVNNRRRATQDTITNKVDVMYDPPAPDQLREVRAKYADRYGEYVTNSTYYYFLNHRVAPFDDKRVREAVNYAVDRGALARLYAGLLEPSCNFLPPGMQGYKKIEPCPWGDTPDLARARSLIKSAGVQGDKVGVWGNEQPESRSLAEYLTDVLNEIGLDARPRIVDSTLFFATVGNQKTKAQAGAFNWSQDFPHPSDFLLLVAGDTITPTLNLNMGNIDDATLDDTLARANPNPDLAEVADDYAAADRRVIEEAHVVPQGNRKFTAFYSERMNFDDCTVWHPVYSLDLTKLCLTTK